jgi:hypothetical protein
MEEIWKDIAGYEGQYQVSNFGNVKSKKYNKEKLLNGSISNKGYIQFTLSWAEKNKYNVYLAHQLIAMAFLGHIPCGHKLVIDHINDNILDNRLENLQIVTNRYNTCKTQGRYSSKYKGVSFSKRRKKWRAEILYKNKRKVLGYFIDEYEAHLAYQNAVKNLEL